MEILPTVGVDRAADMLFVTDNIQAAFAAKTAGQFYFWLRITLGETESSDS